MQQDTRVDTAAVVSSRDAGTGDLDISGDAGITEELLVEEVSIDGMCGVY
jgi:mycofactocin precursor